MLSTDDVMRRKNSVRNNSKDSNCTGDINGRPATANQISNQIRSKNQDTALKSLQAKYDVCFLLPYINLIVFYLGTT